MLIFIFLSFLFHPFFIDLWHLFFAIAFAFAVAFLFFIFYFSFSIFYFICGSRFHDPSAVEDFESFWKICQEKALATSTPNSSAPLTRNGSFVQIRSNGEDDDPYLSQSKTLEQRRDEQEQRELEREKEQEREQENNKNKKKKNPFNFHREESSYRDPYEDDNDFSMSGNHGNLNQVNNISDSTGYANEKGKESTGSKIFKGKVNPFIDIDTVNDDHNRSHDDSSSKRDKNDNIRTTSVPVPVPIPVANSNPYRKHSWTRGCKRFWTMHEVEVEDKKHKPTSKIKNRMKWNKME